MRKRSVEILMSLLKNANGEISALYFTEHYSISERTLKNEVKNINEFLLENGCNTMIVLENKKIKSPAGIDRKAIFRMLAEEEHHTYILLPEEREDLQSIHLIKSREYITLNDLADKLNVSRLTIANDINSLKDKIGCKDINIKSRKGKGVILECSEMTVRKILADILIRNFQDAIEGGFSAFQRLLIETLDFRYSLYDFSKQINRFETIFNYKFSDEEHDKITIFMFISFNRIAEGFIANIKVSELNDIKTIVGTLYLWLSEQFQLQPLKTEQREADNYGLSLENTRNSYIKDNDVQKNQIFAFDFVLRLSKELGIELYHDKILINVLINHFAERQSLIKGMNRKSEYLLRQSWSEQKEIYFSIEKTLTELAANYHLSIMEKDVNYISAYVISAIERLILMRGNLKILVVCTSGIAVSQLLASEIQKYFAFDIQGTCSARDVYKFEENQTIDFVISTVNLYNINIPFVVVNPLLSQVDINNIYDICYHAIKRGKAKTYWNSEIDETLHKLKKIIRGQKSTPQTLALKQELDKLVERFGAGLLWNQSELSQIFKRIYVKRVKACEDWETALRLAASPLVDDGMITDNYIAAMIHNCKENGPYFVIREGLATAHAAPYEGIIKPCFSLLYIGEGVDFHHELFGKVQFLFCLCFQEPNDQNFQILQSLINLAGEKNMVDSVRNAASEEEIYQIIYHYIAADTTGIFV